MSTDKGGEFLAKERHEQENDHYLVSQEILPVEILSLECLEVIDPWVSALESLLSPQTFNPNVLSALAVDITMRDL